MEQDNEKTIYFDKEYDKTYYDLISETSYKSAISPSADLEDNLKSLSEKLIENIGLTPPVAIRDAKALLLEKREVEEGDYCVLSITDGSQGQTLYFVRQANNWVNDLTISDEIFGDKINDWGLREAIESFDTTSHGHPDSVKETYKTYMQGIMAEFDKREPNILRQKQFKIYLNELDRRRNTDWKSIYPQIWELVKDL